MSAFDDFLDDPDAPRAWLLELEAFPLAPLPAGAAADVYSEAAFSEAAFAEGDGGEEGAVKTLYFSDGGFISASTDTPASTWYDGRLRAGMRVERRIIGRDGIGGLARVFAEGTLVNQDGDLDLLKRNYALEGRAARLYVGPKAGARAAFGLVASGITERVWIDFETVRIQFSDGLAKLDRMVNTNTYAGTGNAEGGADLKGKYKPKAYGKTFNVSPPLVYSASLIYHVNEGSINDVTAVYDRGIALGKGADYVSQADMETTAPAGGQYRVWKGGGFFRLGSTPAGTLTCDVEGDATGGYITKPGEIVQRILENQAEFTAGEIDAASFTAFNAAVTAPIGTWIGTGGEKIDETIDELLAGVGAFGGFSRLGKFTVGRVTVSTGAPADTFTEEAIMSIERQPLPASVDPTIWRALVGYQQNYTVQNDFAAAVTAARRAFAAEPIRTEEAKDTAVQSRHKLAKDLGPTPAVYRDQADALVEADRLLDLWGVERNIYRVSVPPRALARDLGDEVTLQHKRHGFAAGVAARVLGHAVAGPKVELLVLV
jgi:hypothetical protein